MTINIALDGPSGAGKSTIARTIAHDLGFVYIDTGALYRAVGLYLLRHHIDPSDREKTAKALGKITVFFAHERGEQHVYLNDEDVTTAIREHQVSAAASSCSAHPEVRAFLLELQRDIASRENVIMDGRDIGTVVLPKAQVKIFLTADPADRARRRYEELISKGQDVEYQAILADVKERDYNDTHRTEAPLCEASDAVRIDTTGNTFEQSVAQLTTVIKERLAHVL